MNTPPFGYAIVDKDGYDRNFIMRPKSNTDVAKQCAELDQIYPSRAPHRIVESSSMVNNGIA